MLTVFRMALPKLPKFSVHGIVVKRKYHSNVPFINQKNPGRVENSNLHYGAACVGDNLATFVKSAWGKF